MNGFRKWALAAYLVLAIFLLARPSTDELVERAHSFDLRVKSQPPGVLASALAAALAVPEDRIQRHLKTPQALPSDLIYDKLLDRDEISRPEPDPAAAVLESGVSMSEALEYFDAVEKRVSEHIRHAIVSDDPAASPFSLNAATLPSSVHGKVP